MNKKQFDKLSETLYKMGYKRYNQHWHHEDYVIGKGFHKQDNKWEENRSAYQIILSIYDYTDKDYPQLSDEQRNHVGIGIHIDVSRTINERIEMYFEWHENTKMEIIENIAEQFYNFVQTIYPEPRE